MPQSFASILLHLVFSTKNRQPLIPDDIRDELHAYIGGVIANHAGVLLKAGSVADHIHLLLAHPRTCSPSDLVRDIKASSSGWLRQKGGEHARFRWQNGYGMFSISPSHRRVLVRYISGQAEHHRGTTFQEEFRRLLGKYGIEPDEEHMWD